MIFTDVFLLIVFLPFFEMYEYLIRNCHALHLSSVPLSSNPGFVWLLESAQREVRRPLYAV